MKFSNNPVLREHLKLNKDILIAFTVSIITSALVVQILSEQEDHLKIGV